MHNSVVGNHSHFCGQEWISFDGWDDGWEWEFELSDLGGCGLEGWIGIGGCD
jgi:hypothetical protein